MNALANFLARMGLKDSELDPRSPAVVALANAEAEWIEECWNAVARAFGERGLL